MQLDLSAPPENRFMAVATGIEFTIVGVNDSLIDVGIIVEYLYDERITSPFQNDVMIGSRLAFNDAESSELLLGLIFDTEGDGQVFNIEGSSRIGNDMKLSIEVRGVNSLEQGGVLVAIKRGSP